VDQNQSVRLEIIGAESLGVRSLCCQVTLPHRRILIDPGLALGLVRHGLPPHPLQIAVGRRIREVIIQRLRGATDLVFSHYHGDHIPLVDANPYQLSFKALPESFCQLPCWGKSGEELSGTTRKRFEDLAKLLGDNLQDAEGRTDGELSFSIAVPHGAKDNNSGSVMMTRITMGRRIFVHASDIQLLDEATVDRILAWRPDIVLAAGPPFYLERLSKAARKVAWDNAVRLARQVDTLILDHHLMRSSEGPIGYSDFLQSSGKRSFAPPITWGSRGACWRRTGCGCMQAIGSGLEI
jgi:predicted metallo-beta-lactamase superfamily hydrolase